MKLYKITANVAGTIETQYVGSLSDGVIARKALADRGIKRTDIKQEEVDIKTDKPGLIKYLNSCL